MLGIQTRGRRMVGPYGSNFYWQSSIKCRSVTFRRMQNDLQYAFGITIGIILNFITFCHI